MSSKPSQHEETAVQEPSHRHAAPCRPAYAPPADIRATETGFVLNIDLPGVTEENVHVDLKESILEVKARVNSTAPEGMKSLYREFDDVDYERSFRLPSNVASDRIEARLKHGVLTVRVPKSDASQPRRIEVSSNQ